MEVICPMPNPWNKVYQALMDYSRRHDCYPPKPPVPLILAGWAYSCDGEKKERWAKTILWAKTNGCPELVEGIREDEFLMEEVVAWYEVGPMGGPMYKPWDYEVKERPADASITNALDSLRRNWSEVAGPILSEATWPDSFTGKKKRRLVVQALESVTPPWGGWAWRHGGGGDEFTTFRRDVNRAISPCQVDHIDFITVAALDRS